MKWAAQNVLNMKDQEKIKQHETRQLISCLSYKDFITKCKELQLQPQHMTCSYSFFTAQLL